MDLLPVQSGLVRFNFCPVHTYEDSVSSSTPPEPARNPVFTQSSIPDYVKLLFYEPGQLGPGGDPLLLHRQNQSAGLQF